MASGALGLPAPPHNQPLEEGVMHEFNEIDWDRVAEGLGFKIAERAPKRILFEIPGTEAAGGGKLLVTDNGGEINLGRIVYRPLECGPSGSIPYASVRNGTVGPYTMVYRIGSALAGEPIDYTVNHDGDGETCSACEATLRTASELLDTLVRLGGTEKAATLRTGVDDFKRGPHATPSASGTAIFIHAQNAAVFVDVALNAIGAAVRKAHYGLVQS
jgi:hypothetical protein